MKTIKNYLLMLAVLLMTLPATVTAQSEKEKEEKLEKQKKEMAREFEIQKKEMEKQKQMMEEQIKNEKYLNGKELERVLKENKVMEEEELRALLEDQKHMHEEAYRDYQEAMEKYKNDQNAWTIRVPDLQFKKWDGETPYVIGDFYGLNRESSALNIAKGVEDLTFSTSFKYDVAEGASNFRFSASGSVDEGTIDITLKNPKGKVVYEFEISPLADVNWSQNFKWSEEEANEHLGQWIIVVSAKDATGNYRVSIRAN